MKSLFLQGFVLLVLLVPALSLIGIDTSPPVTFQTTFTCLKSAGYEFASVRAFSLEGQDLDLLTIRDAVIYAQRAGLRSQLSLRPCRGKNAKFQIDTLVLAIDEQYYNRLWLYLQENRNPTCSWPTSTTKDYESNCKYVKEMLGQIAYFKQKAGVYTTSKFFKQIFGNTVCDLSSVPLIYGQPDGSPSFDGYAQIGNWTTPYGKLFQTGQYACGVNVNKIYQKSTESFLTSQ